MPLKNKKQFNMKAKYRIYQILALHLYLLLTSCTKPWEVSITIQNATPSEPVAIRLSNGPWMVIQPGNYRTFCFSGIDDVLLLAFTSSESYTAFLSAKSCDDEHKLCNDDVVKPPYTKLLSFSFSTKPHGYGKNCTESIKVIAEKADGLQGTLETRSVQNIKFRVIR